MRSKYILLIFLILLVNSSVKIQKNTYEYKKYSSGNNHIELCEFSDEYKEWIKLGDEEKKSIIMPTVCKKYNEQESLLSEYSFFTYRDLLEDNSIPEKYDLRNVDGKNFVTSIKNQDWTGTCWTFGANSSVESNILKNYGDTYDFAEMHMSYYSSYKYFSDGVNNDGRTDVVAGNGGNFLMSASYFTKLKGPILEENFPMSNYYSRTYGETKNMYLKTIPLSEMRNQTTVADVNNISLLSYDSCTEEALTAIKKTIMENGVVQASYYHDDNYVNNDMYIYDNVHNATNHAISIVGWDDTISKTKFKSSNRPTSDGAFIIKNSWGTEKGDNGYYYISYDDNNICKTVVSYSNIDFDVEDNAYYYDELGYIAAFGVGSDVTYVANKFKKRTNSNELLKEITIAFNSNTEYEVFLSKTNNLNNRVLIGSGSAIREGYKTVVLDKPILIENDFSIIVKYDNADTYPIPIQANGIEGYENTSIDPGISYVSPDGSNWIDLSEYTYIPSIKVYTNTLNYDYNIGNITRFDCLDKFNVFISHNGITKDRFEFKILDMNNKDVTNEFDLVNNILNGNNILLEKKDIETENGTYTLEITYDNYLTKTVNFKIIDSYKEIKINNIKTIPNAIINDNKIFDSVGGNVEISFSKHNININNIDLILSIDNVKIEDLDYSIFDNNNDNYILNIKIPKQSKYGIYNLKLYNEEIYDDIDFEIYQYIKVSDINIKYKNQIINEIRVLKDDSVDIETIVVPNNTTLKDIKYEIDDNTIATITNNQTITGLKKGSTTLILSLDNFVKEINITVLDFENDVTTNVSSNVVGNNNIDNYYGGEFSSNISLNYIDSSKELGSVVILNSKNEHVENYFDINSKLNIDNSLNIKIKYNGKINKLNFGNYKVYYSYYINDSNSTLINKYYEIQLFEHIPVQSINTSINEVNLYVDDTYDLNILNTVLKPDNATSKSFTYDILDTNIIKLENNIITGLKSGSTVLRITSENIIKDISITILEKKYLEFDDSLKINNVNTINYIKNCEYNLKYSDLLSKIYTNYDIKIYDNKNELVTEFDKLVSTGNKININNTIYNLVINSEITGDGKINYLDYVSVYNHIYKVKHPESTKVLLKGTYLYAADVYEDNKINYLDYVYIYNKIKEIKGGNKS